MSRRRLARACLIAGPTLLLGIVTVLVLAHWRPGWLIRPLPPALVVPVVPLLPRLEAADLESWAGGPALGALEAPVLDALRAGGSRSRDGLAVLDLARSIADLAASPGIDRALLVLANGSDPQLRRMAREARSGIPYRRWLAAGVRQGGRSSTTPWWGGGEVIDRPAWDAFALDLFLSDRFDDRMPSKYRKDVIAIAKAIADRQTAEGAFDARMPVHLAQMRALAYLYAMANNPAHREVLDRAGRWCEANARGCRWDFDTTAAFLWCETRRAMISAGLGLESPGVDAPPAAPRSATWRSAGVALPDFDGDARILATLARAWLGDGAAPPAEDLAALPPRPRSLVAAQGLVLIRTLGAPDFVRIQERVSALSDSIIASADDSDGSWPGDADNDATCATLAALYELLNRPHDCSSCRAARAAAAAP